MDANTIAAPARKLGLSEKQQAIRRTGVGASEVAAVVGLHPTRKPIDVYLEKIGEAEPFEGNEYTEWGHRIERVVGEAWLDRHPGKSIFTPGTLRHPRFTFALASPDRIVVPPGRRARDVWESLLEIKNVSVYQAGAFGEGVDGEGENPNDEVPEHMLVQVQWQLEVADLEKATLVPLIGGHDMREFPIVRDRELGAMLLDGVARFWADHVTKRVPPPVDGSASYAAFLRRRFPAETGPVLEPTPETETLVRRLREARAAEKRAKAEAEAAAQAVKVVLGKAAGIAGLCTWKANRPSEELKVEAAVEGFLCRLEEEGFGRERARALWASVVRDFTTTKPGARVLRLTKET